MKHNQPLLAGKLSTFGPLVLFVAMLFVSSLGLQAESLAVSTKDSVSVMNITENTLKLADGEEPGSATVEDVAWLAGTWIGTGMGGRAEETWTPPSGGSMVGAFKLLEDGKPNFYEFMTILEVGNTLELRLKHFHPDVTGWEEKNDFVTFPLVKVEPDVAYFRALTYQKREDGGLSVFLAMKTKDGSREYEFVFEKQ